MSFWTEWLVWVIGAAGAVLIAWLNGFLNQFLPAPQRATLALGNLIRSREPPPEDRFRVVLCWLDNDPSGESTGNVAQAFANIEGVTLLPSASIVAESGAGLEWRVATQKAARSVLDEWDADLAIVGLVKQPGKVLSLWIVPRYGEGTLSRGDRPYVFEHATLGAEFGDDFRAELAAVALVAVAPLAEVRTRGRVLERGLADATERLSNLISAPAAIESNERRARLNLALGNALTTLGERESGTERLERAVAACRAALEEWIRERAPLEWAGMQNALGGALARLGEREKGTERLEQAVASYSAALEERTRERVPLDWAMTQNSLGSALSKLGERERGTERLEQAVASYRAALEEWTRERVPLEWAGVQNNLGSALWKLGEREPGTERLEQAVTAYRAALKELSR